MTTGRKIVKWSPPYGGENVEDGVIGRIILNSPEKREAPDAPTPEGGQKHPGS